MRAPSIAIDGLVSRVLSDLDTKLAAESSASGIALGTLADDPNGEGGKAVYTELVERYGYPYVCIEPPEGPVETFGRSTTTTISVWVFLAFQVSDQALSGRTSAAYLSALGSVFAPTCDPTMDTRVTEVSCSPVFVTEDQTFVRIVAVRVQVKIIEG